MRSVDCPKCNQAMSFVPANQNWWCNPCLSTAEGEAPSGHAGPTVDQMTNKPPSAASEAKGSWSWFDIEDLIYLVPLLALFGGGLLIYTGHYIIGGILVVCTVLPVVLSD